MDNPPNAGTNEGLSHNHGGLRHTEKQRFLQPHSGLPKPYVAYFQGPDGKCDRFLVQGMIDREHIGFAAQALVDLLDAIDGDPDEENFDHDLEDDDPDSSVDDKPCDPDSDDDNILPIPGGGSGI